ncbi:efflux RND transporter periplasmic adaptor subunit [Hufsiella ginkgonis]|uniref:Efflux RND transporter periplasmic adaptor subunit n=1 Tax=Hufsiella ginkgonis TaxID=2695274 RepID=A0A7K1Y320_9SPHI|nr:efflux RND transporter periplasmic adaptor subunit [Hufsiella ginkgonis]MXV17693.1 efflux RND transporter periplasmic adaptor subunit [Hufsiella ginkgonis]
MKTTRKNTLSTRHGGLLILAAAWLLIYSGCAPSAGQNAAPPAGEELPVITVSSRPVTTYTEFNASLQGSRDIEIRPQVDGYLQAIFVDEGAYVHRGQSLFRIDPASYQEQLNTANSLLLSAKAALENASINVEKLTPLVQNKVVSEVQLRLAQSAYESAKANVAQATAQVQAARINVGYTVVTAPVDGYVGRIPFKTGSLVGKTQAEALTVLSENKEMHAYFSMSEVDFLRFKEDFPGADVPEKIARLPQVELLLADNSIYAVKGKVELTEGQFGKTNGTISFRATFPNAGGLLRSGNTGKIRIPSQVTGALLVPQEATYELQDKIFVYALTDSNKVLGKPLTITGTTGNYYLVSGGLKAGEKIVYQGISRLHDGTVIRPQTISADSLFRVASL